ncbi:hypothetical protein ATO6_09685 [Oceanicola sp. 22II-s10i]|uniref:DUF2155 domain-containing protein n=1 Tax=Oceanicola sp. 22II-s10i TaxID=1317116 RepID=UPI000B5283A4|nr:DUF2155 domain-containing protein [Oceanicola sp. 22II-s10i]OWU85278.1 hypothetical protein ATO6_09685 [Oceanicola sp. 22II-s10i]
MRHLAAFLIALLLALPVAAQVQDEIEGATTEELRTSTGLGARLKALDKINGQVSEFDMIAGGSVQIGKLVVELRECRYPEDNPEGEAFAYLVISEPSKGTDPVFSGWMIASAPALNALDHFRYDIWVLRCSTL